MKKYFKSIGSIAVVLAVFLACITFSTKDVKAAATQSAGGEDNIEILVDSGNAQVAVKAYSTVSKTGWRKVSGYWYYYKNGKKVKGWLKTGGYYYYLNKSSGRMLKGLQKISGKYYYFSKARTAKYPEGARITGWKKINGKQYFFKTTGKGAQKGRMLRKEWVKVGGNWYFLKANGVMKTGWLKWKGKRYYLRRDKGYVGQMRIGWLLWKGNYYYFQPPNGDMAVNTTLTIDGKQYKFNANGVYYK